MPSATDYAAEGVRQMMESTILQPIRPVGAERQSATPKEEVRQGPSGTVQKIDDI